MSLELILVPAAIAAVAAVRAARASTGSLVVETRMKNRQMLLQACQLAGAESVNDATLTASWADLEITFNHQDDGTLVALARGPGDQHQLEQLLLAVDDAYGRVVQQQVLQRIQANADRLGMRVESQQEHDDSSVTVVLEVLA